MTVPIDELIAGVRAQESLTGEFVDTLVGALEEAKNAKERRDRDSAYSDEMFRYVHERCESLRRHGIVIEQPESTGPYRVRIDRHIGEYKTRVEALRRAEELIIDDVQTLMELPVERS